MASEVIAVSCLWMLLALAANVGAVRVTNGGGRVTTTCLQCICEAVSGTQPCVFRSGTCHDGVCGVFAITQPYWQDAGSPTVDLDDRNSKSAYEKCALDNTCAEASIQGYMDKFHQDCNRDGQVTCEDYTAIHIHGGYSCNQPLSIPTKNALADCLERYKDVPSSQPPPLYPTGDNDVVYPQERTTPPAIDIRIPEK